MTAPFTILHCVAPAPFGGLESVVRLLTIGQQARGHTVLVAANVPDDHHAFVRSLRAAGILVYPFHASARHALTERQYIARLIQEFRIDIVHTHGYRPDILDLSVARHANVGSVTTMHGLTGGDWKVRLYEQFQLRSIRHADAVVAVSRDLAATIARHGTPATKLHFIRNAYAPALPFMNRGEARHTLGLSDSHMHFAWIGRLSHEKGPDIMIEALRTLTDARIALSFIGDGPLRQQLQQRAATLGVAARVTFHGMIPDASRLLPAFDGFVLSSRTEGTPMVLLEAMAAQVPIVATTVGGVPDVVSDTEAWLVRPEAPTAIATAIQEIAAGGTHIVQRTAAAQHRLDTAFDVTMWIDQYEQLYRSILH